MTDVRNDVHVSYGPPELTGEVEQYVNVPGVFLASPPRRLSVETREKWGCKRFTTWSNEHGERKGEWRWAREGETTIWKRKVADAS